MIAKILKKCVSRINYKWRKGVQRHVGFAVSTLKYFFQTLVDKTSKN